MNTQGAADQGAAVNAITDLVREHAVARGDHPAFVQDGAALDYAGLDARMDRVAAALQRCKLGPGDTVAVCGASSIDYAVVFLGALRAGVAVAPLAPASTPESLAVMCADAGAQLLFLDADAGQTLAPVTEQLRARPIALDGSKAGEALEEWLGPVGAKANPVAIQPDWPFNIIYSSGTTGAPKGIVQSHGMRWAHVQRSALYEYGPEAVTLIATPLYSNTTLVSFFPTVALGGTVVLMAKFDAARYLDLAVRHRATHTMLVPVQYQRIMGLPGFHEYDLSRFRYKFCTSAPFAAALKADVLERWPGGLVEFYGMTEGGGTCILAAHEFPTKLHTVGRPAEGHDIRLIDEDGMELPPGAVGEVVGHSPAMMKCYHNQPEKTAEAEWFDASGKRFIRTGDVGRFDADGFLMLMDRRKDMIISGGFNIYPSDLEVVIATHTDVADVAVVGVPSERWGETPVAFVVPNKGASPDPEALMQWSNARLGKTQRLSALRLVGELPRSPIGKILKRELRDEFTGGR